MDPFVAFLSNRVVLDDNAEASKLQMKATGYCLIEEVIYQKSFLGSYLRCLGPQEAQETMAEIH